MKKILLIMAVIYSGSTFCQIGKGTIFLGPSLGFLNSKSEETSVSDPDYLQTSTNRNLNLNLRLGYFIADNVAVGLVFQNAGNAQVVETKNPPFINTNTSKQSINYFGLFGRYYKMINESKIGFFGQLDLMYGIGKRTYVGDNNGIRTENRTDINVLRAGLAPGVVYFVTDRLAFETYFGALNFSTQTNKDFNAGINTTETKTSGVNLNFNLSNFYFGLNFYFGRKKS